MGDAQFIFNQTSSERKRIGRGAAARKNGVKSKKCSLPSDHLTAAQKKKMNGECKKYDLSKPMKWDVFKTLPCDLQSEYIKKLAAMGASRSDVCDMFSVRTETYSEYMNKHHKGERFFDRSKTGNGKNDAFVAWFVEEGNIQTAKAGPEEPTVEQAAEEKPEVSETVIDSMAASPVLQSGSMTFDGQPEAVFAQVMTMMNAGERYQITELSTEKHLVNAVQNSQNYTLKFVHIANCKCTKISVYYRCWGRSSAAFGPWLLSGK